MDAIAFLIGPYSIYWSTIMLTLAAAVGILLYWCFYLWDGSDRLGAFLPVPFALVFSVLLSRLAHWYFRADSYESLYSAMTDYSYGGFALMGAFAGCFLAAALLALFRRGKHFGAMLDAMSVAGCGGVSLGRLACFCNSADRGQTVAPGGLFASVLMNPATGAQECRLATFLLQSITAGVIFLLLCFLFFWGRSDHRRKDGDLFWLFCLYYGGTEAVLDSTRYDSLYFRSNGFVSATQILCLLAVVIALLVFTRRFQKADGWVPGLLALWGSCIVLLGGAGYMEYYVQRHGSEAAFAYSIMSACMVLVLILGTALWAVTRRREIPRSLPTIYPKVV